MVLPEIIIVVHVTHLLRSYSSLHKNVSQRKAAFCHFSKSLTDEAKGGGRHVKKRRKQEVIKKSREIVKV